MTEIDREIDAMREIADAIEGMDLDRVRRVLTWAWAWAADNATPEDDDDDDDNPLEQFRRAHH